MQAILQEVFGNDRAIDMDMELSEAYTADSLDFIEIVMATENEFKVDITDAEMDYLKTGNDFVRLIEQKIRPQ